MTTYLITTTTYITGTTETDAHEWTGWKADDAASCMRARRHVHPEAGTRLAYDVPLREIDTAAGVTRIHHTWTSNTTQPIPA